MPGSPPRSCVASTRTSLNTVSTTGTQRMPILSSTLPTVNPGAPFSTRNAEMRRDLDAGSVTANTE